MNNKIVDWNNSEFKLIDSKITLVNKEGKQEPIVLTPQQTVAMLNYLLAESLNGSKISNLIKTGYEVKFI